MDLTTGIALVGVALAFLAVVYNRRAWVLQRTQAEEAADRVSSLEVTLFQRSDVREVHFATRIDQQRIKEIPLLLGINNHGAASAKDVCLTVRLNNELCYGDEQHDFAVSNSVLKSSVRSVSKGRRFTTLIVDFEQIPPSMKLECRIGLSLRVPSVTKLDVPVTTKDGASGRATVRVGYSYPLDIVVMETDHVPQTRHASVLVHDCEPGDLAAHFSELNRAVEEQQAAKPGSQLGVWPKLKRALSSIGARRVMVRAVLVCPEESQFRADKELPIDRATTLSWWEGTTIDGLYYFPGANIAPPELARQSGPSDSLRRSDTS